MLHHFPHKAFPGLRSSDEKYNSLGKQHGGSDVIS